MFVCHGNICRSPMAEFVFLDIARKNRKENEFMVASSATSTEEYGAPIHPEAIAQMRKHDIPFTPRRAVLLSADDYDKYDIFAIMDERNRRGIFDIFGTDPENKVHLLLEYAGRNEGISDPWYSGNFDLAFDEIESGCLALFDHLAN